MKKIGIIGGGIIFSAALMVSSAGAVLASGSEAAPAVTATAQVEQTHQGIFGTVTEIDGSIITLDSKSLGEGVDVTLDGDTIYKVPGEGEVLQEDFFNKFDIDEEEIRLAILATNEGGEYTAEQVMLVPHEVRYGHINGVVVSTQEQTMTVMNNSGETHQINLPEGVQGGEVGELVSVAVQNATGDGPYVGCGLQTASAVQANLMNKLSEMAGEGNMTKTQEQSKVQLGEQLEELAERHLQVLNDVLEKAPEEAKAVIQEQIQLQIQLQSQIGQAINAENAGSGGQNSN